jgi:hypothetical protein
MCEDALRLHTMICTGSNRDCSLFNASDIRTLTILNMAPRKNRIVLGLTSLSSIISSTTRRTSREFTLTV